MADYAKLSDAELLALVQPKQSDFSQMSDAELMAQIQGKKSSGIGDFFKSIPRGIMSGLSTAASTLGAATQAEMGQFDEQAAPRPTAEQGMAAMEKNVTGPLHQPEGRAGLFGARIGESLGNPVSYLGPGGLALKAGTAVTGALGGEGGRQLAEGTKYEGAADIAGSVLGGAAGSVRSGAKTAIPTAPELKAAGGAGYRAASDLGVEYEASAVAKAASALRARMEKEGIDAELAPKTFRQLEKLENPPPGAFATLDNLRSAQKVLGNIEQDAINPLTGKYTTESMAALQVKKHITEFLENPSAVRNGDAAGASDLIKEANQNHAAYAKSSTLDSKLERAAIRSSAANSGQNIANTTRQRVADILLNPKLKSGWSPDELSQASRVVEGTKTGNALRRVGNLLGAGGGLGQLAAGATGVGLGELVSGHEGGFVGGAALPIAGLLAKGGHNMSVARQTKILDAMIRANSPLARKAVPRGNARTGETTAAIVRALLAQ